MSTIDYKQGSNNNLDAAFSLSGSTDEPGNLATDGVVSIIKLEQVLSEGENLVQLCRQTQGNFHQLKSDQKYLDSRRSEGSDTHRNKKIASLAPVAQRKSHEDQSSTIRLDSSKLLQTSNRQIIDTHSHNEQNQTQSKLKQYRRELHPKSISTYKNGKDSISSAPYSPNTPICSNSIRSLHSSLRRKAAMSIISESAAKNEESKDLENGSQITCRVLGDYRVVHLLYQRDISLYDEILEWKNSNPSLCVDDAINVFATDKGSDAIAQLVYSTEAFDIVLKYESVDEDIGHDKPVELDLSDTIESLIIQNHVSPGFSPHEVEGQFVSLPMAAHDGDNLRRAAGLQLLEPLDFSTDLFPSPHSSTFTCKDENILMEHRRKYRCRKKCCQDSSRPQTCSSEWNESSVRDYPIHNLRRRRSMLSEWRIKTHRSDFQLALLKEGLFIELEKSIDLDAVYVKVLAPFWRLAEEAQNTNCKADLANTILPSIPYSSRILPSFTRLFPCFNQPGLEQRREAVLFTVERLTDFHLAEPGRRWCDVVRHSGSIQGVGSSRGSGVGTDGRPGFFQTSRRGYLVRSVMMAVRSGKSQYGRKIGLRSALRHGVYQKLYALHDGPFKSNFEPTNSLNHRAQLHIKWARNFRGSQPLDTINIYFGERIGIYFAWLGHYTKWLTIPAVVGISVFVFGIINVSRSKKLYATPNVLFAIFDNALTMPFALFMSAWSTVYIEFWKRTNQYYSFRWNMNDYERVELPRTEFRATKTRYSPVTGKRELYYPQGSKALRIIISVATVSVAVITVIGSVACLMIFRAWFRYHFGGPYTAVMVTAILNLIVIIILGEIWCWLAEWLTNKENHKYTNAYENSLIIKRYIFDFTNMYSTLFYYAFFKAPFGSKMFKDRPDLQDQCMYDACITELTVQLAVVFIGKQFLNGLLEMVFPSIMTTWNKKRILADQALRRRRLLETRKSSKTSQWIKDDSLPSYEGRILKCYRKSVIQFGFCTLFVTSFPLAPAFALINNWIGIRMEASRLLTQYRRPIALRAQDIGMWEQIIEFISFVSVITNAAIIAFSSLWIKHNLFVKWLKVSSDGELIAARLGFILVFEHVVYLFKFVLRAVIPNVPLTVKLAVQRSKYMARTRTARTSLDSELEGTVDMNIINDCQSGEEGSNSESKPH